MRLIPLMYFYCGIFTYVVSTGSAAIFRVTLHLMGIKCILLVLDPYYSNIALLEAAYCKISCFHLSTVGILQITTACLSYACTLKKIFIVLRCDTV
jgi:hypothetical protein